MKKIKLDECTRTPFWRKAVNILYMLILLALTLMFFTNDFGLVDLRKTSVIVGMGIDCKDENVLLTAQVAVPLPSENGENTKFVEVLGEGATVAEALKQINAKTGFYPKLVFCKLLILGETCAERDIFDLLDYFYRNDYSDLTPIIVACKGSAGDMLSQKLPFCSNATSSLERVLSEESKKSANVATVNLRQLGMARYSAGGACYMPYIEATPQKTAAESLGESGEGKGGQGQGGASGSGASTGGSDSSGGGEGKGGGGGAQSQSGGTDGSGAGEEKMEFICDRTALYSKGKFVGILNSEENFAFNLLSSEVRHAFFAFGGEQKTCVGLKDCKGSAAADKNGKIKISFSATLQISDKSQSAPPKEQTKDAAHEGVVRECENALKARLEGAISRLREYDCDALGILQTLKTKNYELYRAHKDDFFTSAPVEYEIKLTPAK